MFEKEFVLEYFKKLLDRIKKEKIISRELDVSTVTNKVVVVAGPRRSGKTFLLFSKLRENTNSLYVDLEHSAFRYITHKDFFEIISIFEEYFGIKVEKILIDEVQRIDEWERLVRSLLDSYEMIISGSSSKLLPKEIAASLRGRSLTYLLLPLSFREYLNFKGIEVKSIVSLYEKVKMIKELEEFLDWGGYPEIVIDWDKKEKILREYFETILQKDFVESFEIVNTQIARLIFEFIIGRIISNMRLILWLKKDRKLTN